MLRATQSPLIAANPGPERKALERLFGARPEVLRQPRAHLLALPPASGGPQTQPLCPRGRALPAQLRLLKAGMPGSPPAPSVYVAQRSL